MNANENEVVALKWVSESAVTLIQSEVDEALFAILDNQRQKLDQVDAKQPGKTRRQQAREAGCLCAVAKGAQNRELNPNRILIPSTEMRRLENGTVRISSLKANLPVPPEVQVKAVIFHKDGPEHWCATLEVVNTVAEATA